MKIKKLLTACAFVSVFGAFATEPVKVQFSLIPNPTGDLENPFPVYVTYGQELWGDYNNDGKLDRFIIGSQDNFYLYKNEGSFFSKVESGITPLKNATAVLQDYDNDGNLDIIIAGKDASNNNHNELWRNTGETGGYTFAKDETFTNFEIVDHEGQSRCNFMVAADFDNDGWVDIFATGFAKDGWYVKLYRNNLGYFEEVENPVNDNLGRGAFRQIVKGSVQAGDVNNDGYVDIVLSGEDAADGYNTVTTIYFNNGDGTFRQIADPTAFAGQNRGTTFLADVNNDGYLDIIEMGDNNNSGRDIGGGRKRVANIYLNNGNETFAAGVDAATNGILEMRAMPSVGDVNNDGLVDFLATGGWEDDFTHLYYNNADNTFTNEFIPRETNGRDGVASIVDFDGDGALDISIEGWCDDWHNVLLINDWAEGLARPEAPTTPANFTVTQSGSDVVLAWDKSTDDTTPTDAIRYNIYIQAKQAETDGYRYTYTYAPADISTGILKSTGKPHFISGNTITMKNFNAQDYNFGVQAVDNGWLSSTFSVAVVNGLKQDQISNIVVRSLNHVISIENAENAIFSIYNMKGQILAKDVKSNTSVNVKQQGAYIVKIKSGNDTILKKVVVL